MAQKERVSSALNRLTDRMFVEALSSRDQDAMADLVADFFCGDPDVSDDSEEETEPGKLIIIIVTLTSHLHVHV